ncbi:MAG: acylphosphatase [Candidatus Moranbacteria bacterium]|nr:acylphosphatase [Candidatus Moranbacteria bacterium]
MWHLRIKIYGRVQGVFFRHSAREKAEELGISGFARNEPDGTVYIEAEGGKVKLEKFLEWCRKGPPLARVEKVDFEYQPDTKEFDGFAME